VGIGGIGMSGVAEVLLNLGHLVSGSDQQRGSQTQRLEGLGAKIDIGHRAELVKDIDVLVVSSAVPDDNPEIVEARRKAIPVIPRAEMLAELMRLKTSIAVAGSHGKTSTTSLLGALLTYCGLDPTLVIGGRLNNLGANARLGQGELLVAEADESDGSFLLLNPTVAVVTNIDREHMNFYEDLARLEQTFLTFINRVPFYGLSILCLDDQRVQSLMPGVKKRCLTYGLSAQAEITAREIKKLDWGYSFELTRKGQMLGQMTINVPGRHNVQNALAAAAVGLELGLSPSDLAEGLSSFKGVGRRFELKGQEGGITVLDDYGHHPTEIKATLSALAETFPGRRRVVIFQPHRHSRTKDLLSEFASAFNEADLLLITDIYAAGEKPFEGLDAEVLVKETAMRGHRGVRYAGKVTEAAFNLAPLLKEGDAVMTLGAGNVYRAGEELLALIKGKN
jgi:UDP-N-acetylmuramate--alanine ligase